MKEKAEQKLTSNNPPQFAEDPEVEGEGLDNPHVHQARDSVSEHADHQEGGDSQAKGGGL